MTHQHLLTTVVGSYPQPDWLRALVEGSQLVRGSGAGGKAP